MIQSGEETPPPPSAAASGTCSKTWEGGGFSATKVNFK